jgi:hypothetical protein
MKAAAADSKSTHLIAKNSFKQRLYSLIFITLPPQANINATVAAKITTAVAFDMPMTKILILSFVY